VPTDQAWPDLKGSSLCFRYFQSLPCLQQQVFFAARQHLLRRLQNVPPHPRK
jgi:hypothetical protein